MHAGVRDLRVAVPKNHSRALPPAASFYCVWCSSAEKSCGSTSQYSQARLGGPSRPLHLAVRGE